ncbi:MAG: hypothetical protein Q9191_008326 [Dirinaria sp. TL-2023a]
MPSSQSPSANARAQRANARNNVRSHTDITVRRLQDQVGHLHRMVRMLQRDLDHHSASMRRVVHNNTSNVDRVNVLNESVLEHGQDIETLQGLMVDTRSVMHALEARGVPSRDQVADVARGVFQTMIRHDVVVDVHANGVVKQVTAYASGKSTDPRVRMKGSRVLNGERSDLDVEMHVVKEEEVKEEGEVKSE